MIDDGIYVVFLHYVDHGEQLGFISCTGWIDCNRCLEHCVEMEFVSALVTKKKEGKVDYQKEQLEVCISDVWHICCRSNNSNQIFISKSFNWLCVDTIKIILLDPYIHKLIII